MGPGMVLDLGLTLAVALLVGLLPGYFWARCLLVSAGRVERLVFSVALSVALVPAAALWLAHLLDGGVTFFVAVVAPLVVLGTGLAAYLRFGPGKGGGETLAVVPAPPGVAALGLICAALAVVVGTSLWKWDLVWLAGSCQGWRSEACRASGEAQRFLVPVTLLLLAAGVAYLWGSHSWSPGREVRVGSSPAQPEPSGRSFVGRMLLPAVLLLVLARGYVGVVLHDWPFIRGLDHYSHAVMTNRIMSEGQIEPYFVYPPGVHAMTAVIARISGLDPLEIYSALGPALLLLPALACYALARRLWGYEYGVAAAFFAGAVMGGSYYLFNDAMYPNLVGAQFLLVLAVAALIRLYRAPSARSGLLLALLGSSIVLYHQVSSLYLALLLCAVAVLSLPYLLLRDRRRGVALLLSLGLLGLLAVPFALETYDLPRMIASALGLGTSDTATLVDMVIGTQVPYEAGLLVGTVVSQPVAWLGLLGAVFVAVELARRRAGSSQALAHLTLLLWAGLLFVGSRTSLSGFPQRFGRDLGVPLSVLAALGLVLVVRASLRRREGRVPLIAASLAVFLVLSMTGLRTMQSYDQAVRPSPQLKTTPEIAAAGEWLRANNTGGNIMVSPHNNQVPSRMMLAMGDYSALQSFTAAQIDSPRDLPPTGPGPLEDVLYVIKHPAGERTPERLKRHDVRYVVLYKDMPDREVVDYWKDFKARPDLYTVVFENEDVLIVEPRGVVSSDRETGWGGTRLTSSSPRRAG